MTIDDDIDQNNKMKELKLVTLIEKKDYYNNSDDWIIDLDVFCYMIWNWDFFIVVKHKLSMALDIQHNLYIWVCSQWSQRALWALCMNAHNDCREHCNHSR